MTSLTAGVKPNSFAMRLHRAGLVSREMLTRARATHIPTADRFLEMIEVVQSQIDIDASKYHIFVQALSDACPFLAEELRQYFSKFVQLRSVPVYMQWYC